MSNGMQLNAPNPRGWHWLTALTIAVGIITAGFSTFGPSIAWAFQDEGGGEAPGDCHTETQEAQ